MKIRIKKGDMVKVITGAKTRKGQTGKVLEVDRKRNRVKIENVAPVKRHLKPQKSKAHPEGGIINDFGTIHLSNVMLMSEKLGRPVKTGILLKDGGGKSRVARGRGVKAEEV